MKILFIFGTRPEAIKLAPLILHLRDHLIEVKVCVTGQHREMLYQVLDLFKIIPDYDLNIMKTNQNLANLIGEVLNGVTNILNHEKFEWVCIQGDTASTMAGAMAAFFQKIRVGHVEAGLRTYNLESPFPEELNRQIISKVALLHFAPTEESKKNLLNEGISENQISVTGNTVIDALKWVLENTDFDEMAFPIDFQNSQMILVTSHRRENFGKGLKNICESLKTIAKMESNIQIVFPVHLNPNVREQVNNNLSNIKNIHLIEPLEYSLFVHLMKLSSIILTDSGGIQEEAPSLGKPVLVMRDNTERNEAILSGTVKLVGTNKQKIVEETLNLLNNTEEYNKMSYAHNPYGDGNASRKIMDTFLSHT